MVDYKWKLGAYEIYKVFAHLYNASVKALTLLVKDMLKIKKIKIEGMLYKLVAHQLLLLKGLHPF